MKEMGVAYAGVGKIGRIYLNVGDFLHGICSGSHVVWVRDVGCVTAHWGDLGQLPPQGGQ